MPTMVKVRERRWEGEENGLEKGKERHLKGTGTVSKCLAPPVAKYCIERDNFLWQACKFLVSAAKRQALLC